MPKTKQKVRNFFSYSEEDMSKAVQAVKNGLSRKNAAKEFGVPRTTLIRKLSGQAPLRRRMGPPTELSEAEERVLVDWILAMAKKGFPVHRLNLLESVKKYVMESEKNVRYLNKSLTPGRAWFEGFLRRHPEIKEKQAEPLGKARAAVTQDRIHQWFDEVMQYFREEGLADILLDPSRIFNADEAGFALCPKSGKVLGPTQSNEDFYVRVNKEKEQITVMGTFSADGKVVPPMIIFPYKKMPKAIVESVPKDWALGRSDSGWINSEVFFEFISNHFLPYLKSCNIIRPVVLFVDGHRSHLTQQVSRLCDENGIILISLFPNATHILQPADVSVFKPLKAGWTAAVRDWKYKNFPKDVTRYTFGLLLEKVFAQYATTTTIQNGFRKTGLYPFNKNNVDYTKCIPNRVMPEQSSVTPSHNFHQKVLKVIANKISTEKLDRFLKTYEDHSEWKGNTESTDLYEVWASIKDDCLLSSEENLNRLPHVTGEDEIDQDGLALLQPLNTLVEPRNAPQETTNSPVASTSRNCQSFEPSTPPACETPSVTEGWRTPSHVKRYTYENKQNEGYKIPTPFKTCLPFPKTPEKKPPKRKITIYPYVVSSDKYRILYDREQQKKLPKLRRKTSLVQEKMKEITPDDESSRMNDSSRMNSKGSLNGDGMDINDAVVEQQKRFTPKLKRKTSVAKDAISDDESSESNSSASLNDDDVDVSDNDGIALKEGQHVIVRYEDRYYPGKFIPNTITLYEDTIFHSRGRLESRF